jgi:hypothetical protein
MMAGHVLTRDADVRFASSFNRLMKTKNANLDEYSMEAYSNTLHDLPIQAVEEAAFKLAKQPNSFMPDAGEWYQLADNIAHENLVRELNQPKQLSAPPDVGIEDKRRKARAKFLLVMREKFGSEVANRYRRIIPNGPMPLFHCSQCQDTGWREYDCTKKDQCDNCKQRQFHLYDHKWVEHCVCWNTNPRLERQRAQGKLKTRRKNNK